MRDDDTLGIRGAQNGRAFKRGKRAPLMLYCSSHRTLAAEEIPLYLEAGIRIVPLLVDMWTGKLDRGLANKFCGDWRASVGVPSAVLEQLQTANFFGSAIEERGRPNPQVTRKQMRLLDEYVDAIYVTVYPVAAASLLRWFRGAVIFRAFGNGALPAYSRILRDYNGEPLAPFGYHVNYIWCPLMRSLDLAEEPALTSNGVFVGHFVSPSRLQARWEGPDSRLYIVETIPRITDDGGNVCTHYGRIYRRYVRDFGSLPLRILGGNLRNGGPAIEDKRIAGTLPDREYHETVCAGRLSIYHGESPFHLHYHPIEFMHMGVPVLFQDTSGLAHEANAVGIGPLEDLGMYREPGQAVDLAKKLLEEPALAVALSARQQVFRDRVFSRERALAGAHMLRRAIAVCGQRQFEASLARILTNILGRSVPPLSRFRNRLSNHIRYRYGRWLSRKLT